MLQDEQEDDDDDNQFDQTDKFIEQSNVELNKSNSLFIEAEPKHYKRIIDEKKYAKKTEKEEGKKSKVELSK